MEVDLVIKNGVIIDGTGQKRFRADLGILNGRIAAIAPNGENSPTAAKSLDATGKVLAPGFIELCAFITNSFLQHHGCQNPASFGNFPRVLGRYSRDLGLFPLEEAVRRMTS